MTKAWLTAVVIGITLQSCGTSYNTERKDHKEWVDYSRDNKAIVISLDTVFQNGVPYAYISRSSWTFGDFIVTVRALTGSDHIDITEPNHAGFTQYLIYGVGSVDTACISGFPSFSYCVSPIVTADLLSARELKRESVKAFSASHPWLGPKLLPTVQKRSIGKVVSRDENKDATFSAKGEIIQGGIKIGYFLHPPTTSAYDRYQHYSVHYNDKSLCATVSFGTAYGESTVTIVTAVDSIEHHQEKIFPDEGVHTFINYLIRDGYL